MKYLLIIVHDESFVPTQTLVKDILNWNKKMKAKGILKQSNPLMPPSEAKTIRVRQGKRLITDGPFADAGEKMSAYALIDCPSYSKALAVAAGHPMSKAAAIEVRPVWENLPAF